MCASEPIARSSIQSADPQTRATARTAVMMPSEPKPVGEQAAGLREALGDGCIDEEDVVARAADGQHVLDGTHQLVIKGLLLLAVELRVEPLPELCADGVALG
eukprot:5740390-Pleurochrysis_carterae.AAC.1